LNYTGAIHGWLCDRTIGHPQGLPGRQYRCPISLSGERSVYLTYYNYVVDVLVEVEVEVEVVVEVVVNGIPCHNVFPLILIEPLLVL
jgi:hypothetical protein